MMVETIFMSQYIFQIP